MSAHQSSSQLNEALEVLSNSRQTMQALLTNLASKEERFIPLAQKAFGSNLYILQLQDIQQKWLNQNFTDIPEIKIFPSLEINGANGAFSSDINQIFISQEYLVENQNQPEKIVDVLSEEVGHYVDSQVNDVDAEGDEGEIFSQLVRGVELTEAELFELKAEDDTATITLDGEVIQIEQDINAPDLQIMIGGLNTFFNTVNTDNLVDRFSNFPLIGNVTQKIDQVTTFIDDLGSKIDTALTSIESSLDGSLNDAASLIDTTISQEIGLSENELVYEIASDNSSVEFRLNLQAKNIFNNPIELAEDLALPGLGIQVENAQIQTNLDYDFDLNFGIQENNGSFSFFSDLNEFEVDFEAQLAEDFQVDAGLGFLSFELTDGVDSNSDGTKDEFTKVDVNLSINPEDYSVILDGDADLNLNLRSQVDEALLGGSASYLPAIGTDLQLDWGLETGDFSLPSVSFNNLTVYLDELISEFSKPLLEQVQKVTQPVNDVIGFFKEPIGLLNELPFTVDYDETDNIQNSLLDIAGFAAGLTGKEEEFNTIFNFIQSFSGIADVINAVPTSLDEIPILLASEVNLGTLDLSAIDSLKNTSLPDLPTFNYNEIVDQIPANQQGSRSFVTKIGQVEGDGDSGLEFPILTDPTQALNLLIGNGENVTLFQYNAPVVGFDVTYTQDIPIFGPIFAEVGGKVGAQIDVGFGYDARGLEEFFEGDFSTPSLLANGFYVRDIKNGEDNPELTLTAGLNGGANANIGVAKIGGGIDIAADFFLNLNNPDDDPEGKVYFSEIRNTLEQDPLCLFDASGAITAGAYAYYQVGWPPFGFRDDFNSPRLTVASFDLDNCENLAPPELAIEFPEGSGTLQLQMGPNGGDWVSFRPDGGPIESRDEAFTVQSIPGGFQVSAYGFVADYPNAENPGPFTEIFADGGGGNDLINVQNIGNTPSRLFGGSGNDQLLGGDGNDNFEGGENDDRLEGGGGLDTLDGGSGEDLIEGGAGNDNLQGGADDDFIEGQTGEDLIDGGGGNDFIDGGEENDLLYGDSEATQADAGNDVIIGGEGDDELYGFAQNDVLSGGEGNDTLKGGLDEDELLGDAGNDLLIAEEGNDSVSGGEGTDIVSYEDSPDQVIVNIDEEQGYSNNQESGDLEVSFNIDSAQALDGFGSIDTFNYTTIRDVGYDETTETIIQETFDVSGNLENIIGSAFDDVLIGNASDNEITAQTGNDLVIGNAGNDNLDGGDGTDILSYRRDPNSVNVNLEQGEATDGWENTDAIANFENVVGSEFNDNIIGDAIANIITAGDGSDTVNGRDGNDELFGETGDDSLMGEQGNDLIDGGEGSDTVNYDNSPDRVIVNIDETTDYDNPGGFLHETIVTDKLIPTDTEPEFAIAAGTAVDGFGTEDVLRNLENIVGSEFDDILIGNEADNDIQALEGKDILVGNAGDDVLDGGNDIDTASYRRDIENVSVNLEQNVATDGFDGTDTLTSIENVIGSAFDDSIIGDEVDNIIHAGNGNDFVESREGEDIIFGEAGVDTLYAEDGDDFLVGGEEGDILDGGNDKDTASYFTSAERVAVSLAMGKGWAGDAKGDELSNIENLEGSEFEDLLTGDEGENIISGLAGNDLIKAQAGNDWLDGGEDDDRLFGEAGDDTLDGQSGDDLLKGGTGNDILDGGEGNDQLFGQAGVDTLEGHDGNDVLEGGSENDFLFGNEGNDQLLGQQGDDSLEGGNGDDQLDGGNQNDLLVGGDGDDQLYGKAGIDTLEGNAGNDYLEGGSGDDLLSGDEGNDRLFGQNGQDFLTGGTGNDELDGGDGNDQLEGNDGNDQLYGQNGQDLLDGGDGNDILFGGNNSDTLAGQADDDYLEGGKGNDWLNGNAGDDDLYGQEGDDELMGDDGNDYIEGGTGEDSIQGNAGDDRLYGNAGFDILEGGDGHDILDGGEDDDFLYGNAGSDRLYGREGEDYLEGDVGDDRLEGNEGDDQLLGGEGQDLLKGGDGEDQLEGGTDDDWLLGEAGVDLLEGGTGNDQLDGGDDNDQLYGNAGDDSLSGGQGNDFLYGNEGDDELDGNAGNDFLYGETGEDNLDGGVGNDNLYGGEDNDQIYGGEGNDLLEGNEGDDLLEGNVGDDQLDGGVGNDTLNGGEDNDQIYGRDGNDQIDGGSGNDYIEAGDGNDDVTAGEGVDQIYGNAGNDTLNAGSGNDRVEGGEGDDVLLGQDGNDDLIGGEGDDQLNGGDGNDNLSGGLGNDQLDGGNGDNILNGGLGEDTLTGGEDADTFILQPEGGTDLILNFQLELDILGLSGLTFEEIEIVQGGEQTDQTFINILDSGERLAVLDGIQADQLQRYHFFPVTDNNLS